MEHLVTWVVLDHWSSSCWGWESRLGHSYTTTPTTQVFITVVIVHMGRMEDVKIQTKIPGLGK